MGFIGLQLTLWVGKMYHSPIAKRLNNVGIRNPENSSRWEKRNRQRAHGFIALILGPFTFLLALVAATGYGQETDSGEN